MNFEFTPMFWEFDVVILSSNLKNSTIMETILGIALNLLGAGICVGVLAMMIINIKKSRV